MKQKGSMTAAMSILLLVLLSLITVSIQSSRTACARVQAVNSMDTGLYSLFSEYDRELLERYNPESTHMFASFLFDFSIICFFWTHLIIPAEYRLLRY